MTAGFSVELQELLEIKLGALQDLDLVDKDILKRVDRLAGLFNLFPNRIGDQLLNNLLQVSRGNLAANNLKHALANGSDLAGLGVGGLLDLFWATLGEPNDKEA